MPAGVNYLNLELISYLNSFLFLLTIEKDHLNYLFVFRMNYIYSVEFELILSAGSAISTTAASHFTTASLNQTTSLLTTQSGNRMCRLDSTGPWNTSRFRIVEFLNF